MTGLDGIKLPNLFANKFGFLNEYGVEFGDYLINIKGTNATIFWIILGFIIILMFRNSNQILSKFNLTIFNALFIFIIYFISLSQLNEFSEFLYFNF